MVYGWKTGPIMKVLINLSPLNHIMTTKSLEFVPKPFMSLVEISLDISGFC